KASVPLPIEIPMAGVVKPALTVKVDYDNIYTQPDFAEMSLSALTIFSSSNSYILSIPNSVYQGPSALTLTYVTNPVNGLLFFTQPTAANQGVYQLMLQPASFGGSGNTPRNINIILDPNPSAGSYYSIYTFPEI